MEQTQRFDADTGWLAGVVGGGARTLEEWLKAVAAVRPRSGLRDKMNLAAAVALIHDTPPARRAAFAAEIARRKRDRKRGAAAVVAV